MNGTKVRVMPVILWEGISAVKGESFNTWRKLGPILPAINIYLARNVDEIILLNVSPNKKGLDIDYRSIEKFFCKCNLPLSYGGGVDNFQKIERLLQCGVDKVVIGSACYTDPDFVRACVEKLGSQFVIASIDYKKIDGENICFSRNGTINEKVTVIDHCRELSNIGVGEILLTSIDNEGHMNGYDLSALQEIRNLVDIPIIVNGGAGDRISDFYQPFEKGADAVAASSTFLFTEITPKKVSVELKKMGINTRVV